MRFATTITAAAFAVLVGSYVAWPYWSAVQLRKSLEVGDAVAVSRRVDWPSLRDSMRGLLSAEMTRTMNTEDLKENPFGGLAMALGVSLVDRMVDAMVTPQGLVSLLGSKNMKGADSPPQQRFLGEAVKSAGLVGLTRFEFEIGPPDSSESYFLGVMELRGVEWKLTQIMALKPFSEWADSPLKTLAPASASAISPLDGLRPMAHPTPPAFTSDGPNSPASKSTNRPDVSAKWPPAIGVACAEGLRCEMPLIRDLRRATFREIWPLEPDEAVALCVSGLRSGGQILILDGAAYAMNAATRAVAAKRNLRVDVAGQTMLVKASDQSDSWGEIRNMATEMGCSG
jgi:hypothetical protein